jgi:hypothetical protein
VEAAPRFVVIPAAEGTQTVKRVLAGSVWRGIKRALAQHGNKLALRVNVKLASEEASSESQTIL